MTDETLARIRLLRELSAEIHQAAREVTDVSQTAKPTLQDRLLEVSRQMDRLSFRLRLEAERQEGLR